MTPKRRIFVVTGALAVGITLAACSKSTPSSNSTGTTETPSATASSLASPAIPPTPEPSQSKAPSRAPTTFTVTESSSGKTLAVMVGDKIVVKLQSNPSTGYGWEYTRKPSSKILRETQATYSPSPHATGVVGSGGYQYYRYSVVGTGATSLALEYKGPGGTNGGSFSLKVSAS